MTRRSNAGRVAAKVSSGTTIATLRPIDTAKKIPRSRRAADGSSSGSSDSAAITGSRVAQRSPGSREPAPHRLADPLGQVGAVGRRRQPAGLLAARRTSLSATRRSRPSR